MKAIQVTCFKDSEYRPTIDGGFYIVQDSKGNVLFNFIYSVSDNR